MRPAVLEPRRARRPGVGELAPINPLRTPERTALGALSLAIGSTRSRRCWPTIAFNHVLVGTLLGDAVAAQARGSDYAAATAPALRGAAAVADVLFPNVRERATEFATLTATRRNDRTLGRLIALEGLRIDALGALAGTGTSAQRARQRARRRRTVRRSLSL